MTKKPAIIIVGAVILIALAILLLKSGTLGIFKTRGSASQAVATQPQTSGQTQSGSMAGMPGMGTEKPGAQAPVEDKKAEEAPTIEISPEKQQLIGVKVTTAALQPLKKVIRTVGVIEYDQRQQTTVNTKVEGWIEKLFINYTGMYVKKGTPLAEIYSPELWATQQEFINVVKWTKRTKARDNTPGREGDVSNGFSSMLGKDAEALVEAARQRLKLWDISDEQIRKIEESEKPIRTLTIYSPVSGYVLQKTAVQGMKVMAGEKLFEVADLSTVWIMADIYEYELPLIKVGEPATLQLSYLPGRQFSSRIDFIYPTMSGETRTAKARFIIPNPGMQLKPQMFTNVEVKIDLGRKLAVPEDAVIDTGLRQVVYVDKGNGLFEPKEVEVGIRADKMVEVTAGLKAGDKVASSANFLIDSEAKLKGVEPLALPGRKPPIGNPQGTAPSHKH
jgi:membrane fusion protein, copper/silver efflux system